ncbi:MAG: hypothetical protein ABL961_00620 [Vicinamibacterales bacterium]
MKIVSRHSAATDTAVRPRMYFVHIPKTAGITLKAFLENHYATGESLVIDEWKARELPAHVLQSYRLLSGHYSSEVLDALGERPDVTIMLVREPAARFRSWMAHCRRLTTSKYRQMCEGRTDREVLDGPDGYTCHQSYWLARALRDGANGTTVPSTGELSELLARVDIAGTTEDIERFMQLVSFRMGWPPPQRGWHINRRPDGLTEHADQQVTDEELDALLESDRALYAMAKNRFWTAYSEMLCAIRPDAPAFSPESAQEVPTELVQDWLRRHFEATLAGQYVAPVNHIDITADRPLNGEGWWWRERPKSTAYRWSGPDRESTLLAPPLVEGQDYELTLDAMGAATWRVWDEVAITINGQPVPAVHERSAPAEPGSACIRIRARVPSSAIGVQKGLTRIGLTARTEQSLTHARVEESFDTFHNDMRMVGLALHRVQLKAVAALPRPVLALRRPQREGRAA